VEMKPNDTDKKVMPEPSNLGAALSLMSSGQGWGGQRRENNVPLSKEERDQWREKLLSHLSCFDAEHATFTIRLLNALNQAEEEIARMDREADVLSIWLANAYIDIDLLPEIDSGAMNPPLPEDVREAAREAARKDELQT
jgi:hypothetical protein